MIKAVIFDMDNVVIDSTDAGLAAWKDVLQQQGVTITFEDYKHMLGKKGTEILKEYTP